MSDSPPPSLLITPDTRRRLQQRYEEAARLAGQSPCDFAHVHERLADCLRADPGNILYLDALLANLRRWTPRSGRSWLPSWLGGVKKSLVSSKDPQPPELLLRRAPDLLLRESDSPTVLRELANAASTCDFDEVALRYLFEARHQAPNDAQTLRHLARALTRQGHFEEAVGPWFAVLALEPDAEATQAAEDLKGAAECDERPSALGSAEDASPNEAERSLKLARSMRAEGLLHGADHYLARAQFAGGGDLRILEECELLRMAHSERRLEIARRRAVSDAHPKAQALVAKLQQEHNRLEIDIFHVRSERHPGDVSLRLELARRLKQAGNYSGAIQRLEEARADERLAAEVLLELGECWQHLRQFGKALDSYRQAVAHAEWQEETPVAGTSAGSPNSNRATPRPLVGALYRIGVLAEAMDQPAEAKAALTRLVAIDPVYKDARQRLDNLP
jgi:Flp pilus assembly protein TadD, contains TPR repeats